MWERLNALYDRLSEGQRLAMGIVCTVVAIIPTGVIIWLVVSHIARFFLS